MKTDLENLKLILAGIGYGDFTSLPTYGGTEPLDTSGVWSWDDTHLLVGEGGVEDWEIVPRCPHGEADFHCDICK